MSETVKEVERIVKEGMVVNSKGVDYSYKELTPISDNRVVAKLNVKSLSSIKTYLDGKIDDLDKERSFIHIVDEESVVLRKYYNTETKQRESIIEASPFVTKKDFKLNAFVELESFKISLLSMFEQTKDRDTLVDFISKISVKAGEEIEDDGLSQKVTASKMIGGHLNEKVNAPTTVKLKPFRTFTEVAQPESEFVLRLKHDKYSGVQVGLFESDGGAWRVDAMKNINKWVLQNIKEIRVIS
jgi:hypothetical protein